MKVGFGKFSGEKSSLILMFKLRRLFDFDKIICQLEKKKAKSWFAYFSW